jgi:glycosyltransferase involved in cell wall biosynthesis
VFLEECLRWIRAQTWKNVELVVVDNRSRDRTPQIAERYAHQVHQRGPERSAQRNHGVATTTGEYVLIIDSDMNFSPRVVEACVEQMCRHPELKALACPRSSAASR